MGTPQSIHFHVAVRPDRERVLVAPQGELDLATAPLLDREIEALRAQRFDAIVVDLRELTFMDSTGLRLLVRLDAEAEANGGSFSIIDAEGPIRRLLTLTQLRDRFHHATP